MIGNDIKLAGISKKDLTPENFKKGYIESKQMITIKTAQKMSDVGKFIKETRNLIQMKETTEKIKERLKNEKLIIDTDIKQKEIEFFIPHVNDTFKYK